MCPLILLSKVIASEKYLHALVQNANILTLFHGKATVLGLGG